MIKTEFAIQGTTKESFAEVLERCWRRCAVTEGSMLHPVQRHQSGNLSIDLSCDSKYSGKRVTYERVFGFRLTQDPQRLVVDVSSPLLSSPDMECIDTHLQKLLDEIRTFYGDRYSEGIIELQADSGAEAEQTTLVKDSAVDIVPDELEVGGKYGTYRDLTIDDVRAIVAQCRAFQERGGKVPEFHRQLNIESGAPRSFELETLRGWLKDAKFVPQDDT